MKQPRHHLRVSFKNWPGLTQREAARRVRKALAGWGFNRIVVTPDKVNTKGTTHGD